MAADDTHTLLQKIERNTASSWTSIVGYGLLRGAAFTAGSVAFIALLSWLLSVLGVMPGFGEFASYLKTALQTHATK